MIPIIKKEMRAYFSSMVGYIVLAGFVLFTAFYYSLYCVRGLYPDYSVVLSSTSIVFLIVIPIITMRLFAEEMKQKTDQLLYTAPLKIESIVIGKFLSAFIFFLIGMLITVLFPFLMSFFGDLPVSQITGTFIGYILLGATFISIGLFISVLTDNQIIAAFGTFGALFVLFMIDGLVELIPVDTTSSLIFVGVIMLGFSFIVYDSTRSIIAGVIIALIGIGTIAVLYMINPLFFDGAMVKTIGWFSLMLRFRNFSLGILNVSDIIYYFTFAAAFIYLTVNVIEKRRWK